MVQKQASSTTAETSSFLFDRKIESAVAGLPKYYETVLKERIKKKNALTIAEYIIAMQTEINPRGSYKANNIVTLTKLSGLHNNNDKPFIEMTRDDIIAFLDSYRKPESVDPMHKWIGSYNLQVVHLIRFFKWLYYPELDKDARKKAEKPRVVQNIAQLKRKEQSIYKPTDLWTPEDDILFLRYCPSNRIKCYHAMARDTSCRPGELLKLKIKDVVFKSICAYHYAEALVNGKTGSRPIPLYNCLPYFKSWLNEHHQSANPNAPIFIGEGRSSVGRKITEGYLGHIYRDYKNEIFPRLLDNPNVSPEDKEKIRELLKKPWNPYIRRHTALTEKSVKLRDLTLKQHAGWSPNSKMHLRYVHYFGNEANEELLTEYYRIKPREGQVIDKLKPKICPECGEPNRIDARSCLKCNMILQYDVHVEKQNEITSLHEKLDIVIEGQKEYAWLMEHKEQLQEILREEEQE
jgi:integrase